MPYPNIDPNDTETIEKMDSCVLKLEDSGHDKQSAIAICYSSVVDGKSMEQSLAEWKAAQKSGNRNNVNDRKSIREIRKLAGNIHDITKALEPDDEDKTDDTPANVIKGQNIDILSFSMVIPGAIKTAGDWELDVLGVPYGGPNQGKDSDNQYFSPRTKTYSDQFPSPLVLYYHGYTPDGKPSGTPEVIGKVEKIEQKADGWWYRVVLNKVNQFAKRIWEAAQKGLARASSGSISHLVRIARDGEILNWPVAELSLIDAEGKRQPANAYAVALMAAKSIYGTAGLSFPDNFTEATQPEAEVISGGEQSGEQIKSNSKDGVSKMEDHEILKLITDVVSNTLTAQANAASEAEAARAAEQAKIDAAVKAEREKWEKDAEIAARRPGNPGFPHVLKFNDSAYDHLAPGHQALAIHILKSHKQAVSNILLRSLAAKLEGDKTEVGELGRRAMKANGIKANELDYSTSSGYGDEWVGVAYSQSLWEAVRVNTFVTQKLPSVEVPQGMESINLPIESTDPVWYKVSENTANQSTGFPSATVTSSRIGTGSVQLTLAKLGARVPFTGEMVESSLIPWVDQVHQQLAVSGAEYLESAVFDGDTTASVSNINDTNSGGGGAAGTEWFAVWMGMRHSALHTTTANSRSAGGSLSVEDYLETVKLMGGAGINGLDRSKVSFVVDPNTYYKTMALPEVMTRDTFASPTIENGQLTRLWGYELIASGQIHKAASDRKADNTGEIDIDTTTNNAYGAILAVRWDQWKLGWKRHMQVETTRYPAADTTEIVAQMRVGLIQRDTEAVAETYYVGV